MIQLNIYIYLMLNNILIKFSCYELGNSLQHMKFSEVILQDVPSIEASRGYAVLLAVAWIPAAMRPL